MYNVILIGTRHETIGKCNADELCKIIERINPDVIFEEIPPSYFNLFYINRSRRNLETDSINKYQENHTLKHIPVDSDDIPPESFFESHTRLLKRIEGLINIHGFNYRNFTDSLRNHIYLNGFAYLNSSSCMQINEEIDNAIQQGLASINNEELLQVYHLWKAIHEKREHTMLQNIYNYSSAHCYAQAVFLVGHAHRKSICEKLDHYDKKEALKLTWTFFNE